MTINLNKARGFTLMELMITISIAAIILTLAVPSFKTTLQNSKRAAIANEFLVTLNSARAEALTRHVRTSVCRSSSASAAVPVCGAGTGWEDGWVAFIDPDADNQPNAAPDVLRRGEKLSANITLHGNTNVAIRVTYNLSGASSTNGQIALCDDRGFAESRVIIISLGGRTRSVPGADSTLTSCTP